MSSLYLAHFGLREPPFAITPNPRFFYTGGSRGLLLEALVAAVTTEEGITAAIGEVGSGKTMLARLLVERLTQMGWQVAYLANPAFTPNEIVAAVAYDLGIDLTLPHLLPGAAASASATSEHKAPATLLDRLNAALITRFQAGQRTALVIDEAHAMPAASLDEVRRLANLETGDHKLLQIVLFGQPELAALLQERSLRPLAERIIHRFIIPPLPRPSVREYLEFRLRAAGLTGPIPFTRAAIARIAWVSGGIARRVNLLADKALLAAFSRRAPQATRRDVRRAEQDLTWKELALLHKADRSRQIAIVATAVATVALAAAWWRYDTLALLPPLSSSGSTSPAPAATPPAPAATPPAPAATPPAPAAIPSSPLVSASAPTTNASAPSLQPSTPASAPRNRSVPQTATSSSSPHPLQQWQAQGYTHLIELARWHKPLTSNQRQEILARWQKKVGPLANALTLLPPVRPGDPYRLVLGPYRSSNHARQAILELPAEVLFEEPLIAEIIF